ncbi:hypothetical protein BH09PLA1_BH09PLA1_02120 [soil metagenome]
MSEDEQAIRNMVDAWMSASKSGDHTTLLSLMTDDVVFMIPGQAPFGKEAFENRHASPDEIRIDGEAEIVELKIPGDWAWLRNRLRLVITPKGRESIVKSGYTLTILRRNEAGRWQLKRDANLLTSEPAGPGR